MSGNPISRWVATVLCAGLVGFMFGVNPKACDPNADFTLWDRVQLVIMFVLFVDTGWQWGRYILERELKKINDERRR